MAGESAVVEEVGGASEGGSTCNSFAEDCLVVTFAIGARGGLRDAVEVGNKDGLVVVLDEEGDFRPSARLAEGNEVKLVELRGERNRLLGSHLHDAGVAEGVLADVIELSKPCLEAGISQLPGVPAQVRRRDVRLLSGRDAVLVDQLLDVLRLAQRAAKVV